MGLLGVTSAIKIKFIGFLSISEIFVLLTTPLLSIKKIIKNYPDIKKYLLYLFCLLIFQILSDALNNTSPFDFLRGWGTILISILLIVYFVSFLSRDTSNIIYYLLGLAASNFFFPDLSADFNKVLDDSNYFKQVFVPIFDPIIMVIAFFIYKKNGILTSIFLILSGLIYIFFDARSSSIFLILTGLTLLAQTKRRNLTEAKVILYFIIMLIILYIAYVLYIDFVVSDYLQGKNSQNQVELMISKYNPIELFLYGRPEILPMIEAIKDSFFIGHGSWALDTNGYYLSFIPKELRPNSQLLFTPRDYIPSHSVILGYWVFSGFFGFLCIFFLFLKFIRQTLRIFVMNIYSPVKPIIFMLFYHETWNFLFSPTQTIRTELPIFLSLLIIEFSRLEYISNESFSSKDL